MTNSMKLRKFYFGENTIQKKETYALMKKYENINNMVYSSKLGLPYRQ